MFSRKSIAAVSERHVDSRSRPVTDHSQQRVRPNASGREHVQMSRFHLLPFICATFAVALYLSPLRAAPIAGPSSGLADAAAATDLTQLIHGCHRSLRRDRWGWHRHGVRCRRIR